MDRAERLIRLFHRRWSIPILAELHRSRGAKFVTLHVRLGASAGAVRETLDDLIDQGLVVRNPGYGHPLRPEYVLTPDGEGIAASCAAIEEVSRSLRVLPLVQRKWPMPILDVLGGGAARFAEIGRGLPRITDRALAMGLRELGGAKLVLRRVEAEHPPVAMYVPAGRAAGLIGVLGEIV